MESNSSKPQYLLNTDKWAFKACIAWCAITSLFGCIYVGVTEGIAIPLMTLFMVLAGSWMLKILLAFHKSNPFVNRRIYDSAVLFFWAGGILGFASILAFGLNHLLTGLTEGYFFISASIFPLGVSIGASKKWEQRFEYE